MKKVLYSLMIVLLITAFVVPAGYAQTPTTVLSPTIYANTGQKAGYLKVTPNAADGSITIKYMLKMVTDGWCMTSADVHVGRSLDDFPLNENGANPAEFDFHVYNGNCISNFTATISPDQNDPQWAAGEHVFIAVHVVLNNIRLGYEGVDGWTVRCGCIPGHIFPGTGITLWFEIFAREWQ